MTEESQTVTRAYRVERITEFAESLREKFDANDNTILLAAAICTSSEQTEEWLEAIRNGLESVRGELDDIRSSMP